ncbi:hypothetical protein B0H34DRAFT_24912 [Crassisporium funariophilum]|nr:hypothetical protein B0H34DRAFT_24912 [Crassisporium funariophilum]
MLFTISATMNFYPSTNCGMFAISCSHYQAGYIVLCDVARQFNSKPSCMHFLLAKHVLQYLSGTKMLELRLGALSDSLPSTLTGYMQNIGCTDADLGIGCR